ncbi:inosine monophosphate dehydrogenase [Aspergillus bertholletiae]|uniref:Inosine monophosphate dehydrogenase n=1 Tax=Aspergillus bertholletiae TaxID=1226010 RepID=A0A5N7ARQ5_9EURO|nr:inosine monophosphate dehydrogenase [Aspergillus bertholletiae]
MSNMHKLKRALPWVQTPIIINAPMSGVATSDLAVAVTRAGGLGQIGFLDSKRSLAGQLHRARHQLQDIMNTHKDTVLPVGVGMIVFGSPVAHWLSLFSEYRPAVVWLSFATTDEFKTWTEGIRKASPRTQIWIQVGSVSAALEAAQACHPDALVLQGSDAGGHGHALGASVISLLPEVADVLQDRGIDDISLIAAGGIMDGRGTAAAIMLGAAGVVMGTRFLGAEEAELPQKFREAVFDASDGGQATVRSKVFDEMWGPSPWPELYDGRCLRNSSYEYVKSGMSMSDMRVQLYRDLQELRGQQLDFKETATVWAGAGVGMVKKSEKAADIVEQVQSEAQRRLQAASSWL